MNEAQRTRTEWVLTGEAFDLFLSCLDADAEQVGEKYEAIRRKLIKYFDWRGAHFPEECADETINRVIRKLESGETIRDIPTYCYGIARLVFLETLKKPDNRRTSLDELIPVAAPQPFQEEESAELECFERCLSELPEESRQLILQYYQDERREKINNRQAMADRLGIPLNALRSRVQRIRDKLERCAANCLGKPLSPRDGK
ncbi:MAG: RNA polymerase sigma factor [Blastocatellia bacterium]|nr:RNA polymerase sigma factor [Blastocatellia bacterium]